jgi:hypothetical protein
MAGWKSFMSLMMLIVYMTIPMIMLPGPVRGDEFKVVTSASLKEAYNDNVYFTTTGRKSDWVSTLSPAIELIDKTERFEGSLSARFNGIYYLDQTDLNAVDQFYRGKFRYALTNRLGLGAEAGYARDSQATREIDTTGVVFATPVNRERQNYGVSGDWRFTDTTLAALSYDYGKDRYDKSTFTDLESQRAGLNFLQNINPTTKGRLNLGYANYRVTGLTLDSYSSTIGISRDFNNLWSILIDLGASYTRTRFNILTLGGGGLTTQERTNEGWGPMGQIALAYKHERTNGSLTLNRSVMPVSGTAGSANRSSLSLDLRHKFTYELSGYVTASYFLNKSDPGEFSNTIIDQTTSQISIGPRYDFNKEMFLTATYTYSRTDYGQTKTTADQHLVMLMFNIQHAIIE